VTGTQETERHDEAVREQIRNADRIRAERREQGGRERAEEEGMPPPATPLPAYPRENPWAAGATNNGDIGRNTAYTMPLYDRRSEYQKHCEWPTVGYRPGTEPMELAYADQEPDLPPEPWRDEWRADRHTDPGMRAQTRANARTNARTNAQAQARDETSGRAAPHPDAHRDARS
jgi:hypothetical protein